MKLDIHGHYYELAGRILSLTSLGSFIFLIFIIIIYYIYDANKNIY
jgi:hypothetical protein